MIKKLRKAKKSDDKKQPDKKLSSRITNDTVAQHREKVLAGGRKHKYPVQYTKYKLVWNTIIISSIGLVALLVLVYLQLYVWKDTSELTYRITRLLPVPAASVDGEQVRYSDYLMYHRSTLSALAGQKEANTADRIGFQKGQAMDRAVEAAYVRKLARQYNVTVTDQQVTALQDKQQQDSGLSKSAYEAVVNDRLHWSMDELKHALYMTLLKQEVAFTVDKTAFAHVSTIEKQLRANKSLADIAKELGDKVQYVPDISVPKNNSDGGLTATAARLPAGKVSPVTRSTNGDGYYFIQPSEIGKDTVKYSYLKVPLTVFKQDFEQLKKDNKITYYVKP